MSAPRLNRRMVLEARGAVPDGAGGLLPGWTTLGMLWAELAPRTGREAEGAAGALSRMGWKITVRGAPPGSAARPEPGQRLREGARAFRILAVAERDADGRYLTCFAEEEIAA